ncbi:SIMPL domain-containing protein [Priestia abyssalis]|uniref:SIMPL domain-containing protein n=1 Tax=Priestia abyssalis TaxID=1221450 RepID=UPI000995CAE9|nr:SIMPL domain-containing protein [Priestia abyssalis]
MNPSFHPYPPHRNNAASHSQSNRTITVYGQGTIEAMPDTIMMTIGITTENQNVQEALRQNSVAASQLIEALHQLGLSDQQIETSSFTINPKYEYSEGKSTLIGYEVQHLFTITVKDVKQAGEVYASAVANGANIARNLQFQLQNADLYYQEALKAAVQNATEKAYTIARSLRVTLQEQPIEVIEETLSPVYERSFEAKATVLAASSVPPIQPGEQQIEAKVKVVFSYV